MFLFPLHSFLCLCKENKATLILLFRTCKVVILDTNMSQLLSLIYTDGSCVRSRRHKSYKATCLDHEEICTTSSSLLILIFAAFFRNFFLLCSITLQASSAASLFSFFPLFDKHQAKKKKCELLLELGVRNTSICTVQHPAATPRESVRCARH